jgi:hypothetical protein
MEVSHPNEKIEIRFQIPIHEQYTDDPLGIHNDAIDAKPS